MDKDKKYKIPYDEHIESGDTPVSWLLRIDTGRFWFPKSICDLDEDLRAIWVPYWLIERKELEDWIDELETEE